MYELKIDKKSTYADEDIEVSIKGDAYEKLVLIVTTDNLYSSNGDIRIMEVGTKWKAEQEIILDNEGKGVVDAKIFTKMKIVEGKKSTLPKKLKDVSENRMVNYLFELKKQGQVVATLKHIRMFCDESIYSEDISSKKLLARYFIKKELLNKKNEVPAIMVVSGSDGRIERAQVIAECLARYGFATLAICYFGMDLVSYDLNKIPIEYIEEAISWLKNRKEISNNNIGIYGRSKGGEFVLIAASILSDIKSVVANTPSLYSHQGLITKRGLANSGSWIYNNKEIPYIKASKLDVFKLVLGFIKKDTNTFRKFYERITWGKKDQSKARILIEKSNAKYLFLSSDTDAIWPSDKYSKEAVEVMKKNNKEQNITSYCYAGSGHMLTIPYQPIPDCQEYGGILEKGVDSTIDAWQKTVEHFKNTLSV